MRLSSTQRQILILLQQGGQLKVHRTADGSKVYCLHLVDAFSGGAQQRTVAAAEVAQLEKGGLLASNMKFPAATFLLTEAGVALASQLTHAAITPTGPRNYR